MKQFILLLAAATIVLTAAEPKPKLLVAIVIDQFRYDYLLRFRQDYNSGLAQLLEQGAVFADARYIHFPTVTAIGHSTFMTGATPLVSGIVENSWYDRALKHEVTSVSDPSVKMLGGVPGAEGSSPRALLVSTVGDELKMAGLAAKVIGISIKDRSAILPVGHMADAAYWFDNDSNHFVSSSYYFPVLPPWVGEFNDASPAAAYQGAPWTALEAAPGAKPFCSMVAGGDDRYCGPIEATPFGNEMIEAFAERAIIAEQLGKHAGTDVLAISFSSNDYVGHAYGPDAPQVRDVSKRTDRLLGKLFAFLAKEVSPRDTLVVLTADHGVAPAPEVNVKRKMPGGRVQPTETTDAVEAALSKRFGKGPWVVSNGGLDMYLDDALILRKNLDGALIRRVAADAVLGVPHIARVFTRDQLLTGQFASDAVGRAVANSFYAKRSGDLFVITEPYWIFGGTSGSTHGSPFGYDTHVPLIFFGAGIKAGTYYDPVTINDVAPTLAAMLGIEAPSGSSGRVLSAIIP